MNESTKKAGRLEINVGELLFVLLRKWWLIAMSGMILALLFVAGTKMTKTPMYQSATKIFVLTQQDGNYLTSTDIQVSSYLTKDYAELIKSRTVAQEVIERLDLNMSPEALMNRVTVETKTDTRIVTIVVENEKPELAQMLANVICEVSAAQIVRVMGVQAVNVVDEANLPGYPSGPNLKKSMVLGAAWGIVLSVALILLPYLLNDTIKSDEDVERYLNLSVLALIPNNEPTTNKKRGKVLWQTSESKNKG